jgi:hypothetical protein
VVFLPPKSGAVPESASIPAVSALTRPAYAQVAAIGTKTTWAKYSQLLVDSSSSREGSWHHEEVPDGTSAHRALSLVRKAVSGRVLGSQ